MGSAVVSGVLSLMAANQKDKRAQMDMMLGNMRMQGDLVQEARSDSSQRSGRIRGFIAIVGLLAVVVLPKVVPIIAPWMDVWVGWTQWNPGFLFIEGREVFTWKAMNGLVITPLDTHLVSSIIGFYLGGALTKR